MPRYLREYPLRVSRADAIALANRGKDYPVHAAFRRDDGTVVTGCGRKMHGVNVHDRPEPDCELCRKLLVW